MLAGLFRNRVGPLLLIGQVALTLAIVANAALIAWDQMVLMQRPTGVIEDDLLSVHWQPVSGGVIADAVADADLHALRNLPDVVQVTRINFLPLGSGGWRTGVSATPFTAPGPAPAHAALFFGDENAPRTLGVRLTEGRAIAPDDVGVMNEGLSGEIKVALISQALAQTLFPGESAIGKRIYSRTMPPVEVIGVVDRLQSAWPMLAMHENAMLMPARLHLTEAVYAIRTRPGAIDRVAAAIVPLLRGLEPERIIDDPKPYRVLRGEAYSSSRALISMLGALAGGLLFITALGIGGTAAFWVASRVQQIATRRALGASRRDILRHFMFENFVITSGGALLGSVLAVALNRWLIESYAVAPLRWYFPGIGVLLLYASGQAAVLGPALRAAAVPPAVATRGA